MAKNNKNKPIGPGKKRDRSRPQSSDQKTKRDGKPKKTKEVDHLDHIPFKLREIMKSKDKIKNGTLVSKKHKAITSRRKPEKSMDSDIPVPHFKRRKNESEKAYLRRMNNETNHVRFLTKNQIDRKPELDADKQEKPAKNKSDKKKEFDKMKLQKLHQKKLNKKEAKMEKEMFVDHVPFGEVSMAPPTLNIKPRKAQIKSQNSTKDLLLNSLLGNTASSMAKPSMARQRIMEEERQRAVEAYRHLKKQQQQQQHEAKNFSQAKKRTISDV
ncbi:coiled-coil domain-containing protein 137 [Cynoglossus semilaevis]|uniref:Coiled-coil domain containing 137 n=1 Tax=Cynoglossus semilaevis TaxID=244447 RepID=A0A3P8VS72_CYNSE|nr:coiled-coil domain-containing protein 137 [Cynoglossus semilaevis]